jgi:hypothetical protein
MLSLFYFLLAILASPFKSKNRLEWRGQDGNDKT